MIVLPDIIRPTITWLINVAEVTALVGNRIGTQLPQNEVWPAIRLDLTGGFAPVEFRLDRARVQIQCFDISDAGAVTVARTIRAAMYDMVGYRVPGQCVVVDVETSSPQLLEDLDRTPPISHASLAATVTVRPDP